MKSAKWSITDLVEICKTRQNNKFDVNFVVSGARGNGKSTLLFKLFLRFKQFKPWKNVVYSRKDVIKLLEENKFGIIMDDEAIRSAYKRNFYEQDQKTLIQMLNMYRDNFNIYGMAVPNFYSLDKDLRDLVKIHLHVIERGIAVVHIANEGSLYSEDMWDVKYNKKIEERWSNKKKKNPNFRSPYHKLSTFRGYLIYNDLTPKQRALYEEIKQTKRKEIYETEMKSSEQIKEKGFYDRLIDMVLDKKINSVNELINICIFEGKNYSSVRNMLNQKLRDRGIHQKLSELLCIKETLVHTSDESVHNNLPSHNFNLNDKIKVI